MQAMPHYFVSQFAAQGFHAQNTMNSLGSRRHNGILLPKYLASHEPSTLGIPTPLDAPQVLSSFPPNRAPRQTGPEFSLQVQEMRFRFVPKVMVRILKKILFHAGICDWGKIFESKETLLIKVLAETLCVYIQRKEYPAGPPILLPRQV